MKTPFEAACLPHRKDMVAFAQKLCRGSRSNAEDVVQDALVRAWSVWARFEPVGDPTTATRGWLLRIVYNEFARSYRRRLRLNQVCTDHGDDIAEAVHTTPEARHDGLSDEVETALAKLNPVFREVIELFYVEGLSCNEIAETLGIPLGSVLSRLYRGKKDVAPTLRVYASREYRLGSDGAGERPVRSEAPQGPQQERSGVDRVVAVLDAVSLERAQASR